MQIINTDNTPLRSPRHLVLRVPGAASVLGRRLDVVEAHNQVVGEQECVAVGKWGAVPKTAIHTISDQLRHGQDAFLYLVSKQAKEFRGVRAPLRWLGSGRLPAEYQIAVPAYYEKLFECPTSWFVVNTAFEPADLAQLHLASNGRDLLEVLAECRTAAMLVDQTPSG